MVINLKKLREDKDLSAEELAEVIEKSVKSYYHRETGHVRLTADELFRIAKHVGESVDSLKAKY